MSDSLKTIDELQKQIWDCVKLNSDNPLGYTLLDAHFARIKRIMAAERLKAQLNMIEYYDQIPSNDVMDWKGLLKDNKQQIKYELEQLIAAGE